MHNQIKNNVKRTEQLPVRATKHNKKISSWWRIKQVLVSKHQLEMAPNVLKELNTVCWTLVWGFRADKTSATHWSGGRVQVWVQVRAPAGQLAFKFTPEGYSRKQSKVLTAKSTAKLLGRAQAQLGRLDCRAQAQGVFESAAVASGSEACDWLAWGKRATTLAILTQFESQKEFNAL